MSGVPLRPVVFQGAVGHAKVGCVHGAVRAEAVTHAEGVERREAMIDLGQVGRNVVRGLEPALLVRGDGAMLHQRAASRPDRLAGRRT